MCTWCAPKMCSSRAFRNKPSHFQALDAVSKSFVKELDRRGGPAFYPWKGSCPLTLHTHQHTNARLWSADRGLGTKPRSREHAAHLWPVVHLCTSTWQREVIHRCSHGAVIICGFSFLVVEVQP